MEQQFVFNKLGVCLNPLVLWSYDTGNYPEATIEIAPIGDKWDSAFNWMTLRGGEFSPVSMAMYSCEEAAIDAAIARARKKMDYIKSLCRNESEFNKLHESFIRFIASRTQLSLF
jgi:hypothetical protein